jgi:alkylresorcinol/alkylpyrone synthase
LLVEPLGLRADVRRQPITELGCAGGACGLSQAHAYLKAYPAARVLVVAVELPSLTFQTDDASPANLVASSLFGDGAAAVLLGPGTHGDVEIVATHAEVFPASLGDMGFDLRDRGLHVVLSKDVPRIVAEHTPGVVRRFLGWHGLAPEDLAFAVLHPGGRKVLEALENGLALDQRHTAVAWDILRDFGNQSSAAVLFVLGETLRRGVPPGYGLLAAFGPGIAVELSLLRSQPC